MSAVPQRISASRPAKSSCSRGACQNRQCLFPTPCSESDCRPLRDYLALLRKLRAIPGVKKVFIRSGIRFDYVLADPSDVFFKELVTLPHLRAAEGRA